MSKVNKNVIAIAVLAVAVGAISVFLILRTNYQTTTLNDITAVQNQEKETESDGKYLEIKEYGVRLPILAGMEDISYEHISGKREGYDVDYIDFDSSDLAKATANTKDAKACADYPAYGVVSRTFSYPDGDDMPMRDGTYVIGSYYVGYTEPQDTCTQNKAIQQIIYTKTSLIQQAFKKLEGIDGKVLKVVQQGHISGSLSYPSEEIPINMTTCAERVDKSESYCQSAKYLDPKYKYGKGFEMTIPAGDYYVYSTLAENPRDPKAERAYYNQAVKCGLTVECKDKTPIVVKVKQGAMLEDIDPIDWY